MRRIGSTLLTWRHRDSTDGSQAHRSAMREAEIIAADMAANWDYRRRACGVEQGVVMIDDNS